MEIIGTNQFLGTMVRPQQQAASPGKMEERAKVSLQKPLGKLMGQWQSRKQLLFGLFDLLFEEMGWLRTNMLARVYALHRNRMPHTNQYVLNCSC